MISLCTPAHSSSYEEYLGGLTWIGCKSIDIERALRKGVEVAYIATAEEKTLFKIHFLSKEPLTEGYDLNLALTKMEWQPVLRQMNLRITN